MPNEPKIFSGLCYLILSNIINSNTTSTFDLFIFQFSPMGHYFASSSHDRTARIWSMDRIQPLRIMAGHLSDVDVSSFCTLPPLLSLFLPPSPLNPSVYMCHFVAYIIVEWKLLQPILIHRPFTCWFTHFSLHVY